MAFTNQTGDGTSWPTTVEQAANGDGTSSFWANTFVPLLNRTKYLYDNLITALVLGAGKHYGLSGRSVTRTSMPVGINDPAGSPTAFVDSCGVAVDSSAIVALGLPHGATLTKCSLSVDPTNATPPAGAKIQGVVYKRNLATASLTTLVTTTDPTTSTAYGAQHMFDTGTIAEVIDRTTYAYFLQLIGETGTGKSSCTFYGGSWTATITGIDDGVA